MARRTKHLDDFVINVVVEAMADFYEENEDGSVVSVTFTTVHPKRGDRPVRLIHRVRLSETETTKLLRGLTKAWYVYQASKALK